MFAYVSNSPLRLVDPWGLFDFPYYKRWGGPGRTAGRKGSWDEFSEDFRQEILRQIQEGWDPNSPYEPRDAQDTCYMHHDICYGEARMQCKKQKTRCPSDCEIDRMNQCDSDLTKCLVGIGLSGNPLDEARRIAAVPVFLLQPGVRNAVKENKEKNTNHWLLYRIDFKGWFK